MQRPCRPERRLAERRLALAVSVMTATLALAACNKNATPPSGKMVGSQSEERPSDAAPKPAPAPTGPTGTITGKVELKGQPPKMVPLRRGVDAFCAKTPMNGETVVANKNGTLRNVLVRIKPGTVKAAAPHAPVVVDQKNCMYRPRVQGAVVGQELLIKNEDPTFHNVHARAMKLGERAGHQSLFNSGQPPGMAPIQHRIGNTDIIALRCDAHAWMRGYVLVSDNPYFSVTGKDGAFTIENVPVGTYTLQAWQEYYGLKTAKVTVTKGKTAQAVFTYDAQADKPGGAGAGPSAGAGKQPHASRTASASKAGKAAAKKHAAKRMN